MDGGGRCRTDRPKGKTPQLTCQLTWPLEIKRVRPWVSVKIGLFLHHHDNNKVHHDVHRHDNDKVHHDVIPSLCRFCRDVLMEQGPS